MLEKERSDRVERERQRIQRLIADGRCVRCGRPTQPGRRMCKPCAAREAERKYYARHERVAT